MTRDRGPWTSNQGPLIVVSGPSGVGKTTVVERLIERKSLPLRRAVTATTREQRPGETDDTSYHFWTQERFLKEVEDKRMLEYARVFDRDYYGTPRSEVDDYRPDGIGVVLVIDVQGAAHIREKCPGDNLSVFIAPPTFEELEKRLRSRRDMSEDRILRRLETARVEMARRGEFDHEIVNDDLGRAVEELEGLIRKQFAGRGN